MGLGSGIEDPELFYHSVLCKWTKSHHHILRGSFAKFNVDVGCVASMKESHVR